MMCVWQMANGECQRWAVKKGRGVSSTFILLSCSKIVENKFYVFIQCVDLFSTAQQQSEERALEKHKIIHPQAVVCRRNAQEIGKFDETEEC